jgi:hypothetical protein
MMKNAYIYCLDLTSVWRWRRRRRLTCAVERRWRRPVCALGRAAEEIGSSGVDCGREDRRSRERWGLREFYDKKAKCHGVVYYL